MEQYLVLDRPFNDGTQKVYRFENRYGASVVKTMFSYGGTEGYWELAVLEFASEEPLEWELVYSTPITDDVLGWLSWDTVEETLQRIKGLPSKEGAE